MVTNNPAEKIVDDQNISVPAADISISAQKVNGKPQSPQESNNLSTDESYDENQSDKNEFGAIPYKRFKEVIDERNKLRDKLESQTSQPNYTDNDFISDEELKMIWQTNPLQAARATFAQIISSINEDNRIKNESLNNTIKKYPELADPQSDLISKAKSILDDEMPALRDIPSGLAVAAELAAARYYKKQYNRLAGKYNDSLKGFEATREANLRNTHIEYGSRPVIKDFGNALNSDEQRVAALMGVPIKDYIKQKSTHNKRSS